MPTGIMTFAFLQKHKLYTLYKELIIDVKTWPHIKRLVNHLPPLTDIHEHNLCYMVLFDVFVEMFLSS